MEYFTSACNHCLEFSYMLPPTSRDTKNCLPGYTEICISHDTVFASGGYEELTLHLSTQFKLIKGQQLQTSVKMPFPD